MHRLSWIGGYIVKRKLMKTNYQCFNNIIERGYYMSVTAGVVAKKVAVALLSDKKTWKVIAGVIAGLIILCLIPAMVLMAMLGGAKETDYNALAAEVNQQQIIDNMTPEQIEKMEYFQSVLLLIDDEITKQDFDINPIKAQIIFISLLWGKEKESETFYADYIICFKDTENDNQIFSNIADKYSLSFTDEDKKKIIEMYEKAISSQILPPNGIHTLIAELQKTDPTHLQEGAFLSPLHDIDYKKYITSPFGYRTDPVNGEENKGHTGVDIGVADGTPIYASKAGKVLFVKVDENGYGNYLAIDHGGGYATMYAHCSKIIVKEGENVTANTIIAKVGSTGKSTGYHLHFEVVKNGIPENPRIYIDKSK